LKKYIGNWELGKKNGQGTQHYNDGSVYKGFWKNGKRQGKGVLDCAHLASGYVYDGDWSEGSQCGEGSITYKNGATYTGQWRDGKFHGHGTITYDPNHPALNVRYSGEWQSGKRHGKGELILKNNNKFKGYFKDDQISTGKFFFSNGTSCEGRWNNGIPEGKCIIAPIESSDKKYQKNLSEQTYEEFTVILSGTVNEAGFLECGENKHFKIPQIYPNADLLPILEPTKFSLT